MFETDPATWTASTWVLYGLGALFLLGFMGYWFAFESAERAARRNGGPALARYNRMLRGFPNAVYAKMFGKRSLETVKDDKASERQT